MNVYTYTDYRLFLKDYYEEMKKNKPYFSYRHFSELAGVTAPNFLYLIIKGDRNLSKKSIVKVSKALGLIKQEHEYFENMVFYNQAKTVDDKNLYYSSMIQSRKDIPLKELSKDQLEYLSEWYYCAVREIVPMINFKGNYTNLAEKLKPRITPKEAQKAVELLVRLQLLKRNNDGTYEQTDSSLFMRKHGAVAISLEDFHNLMMQKAIEANKSTSRKERLLASTTFSISHKTLKFFIKRTREFRRELQEIARLDKNPEQVFQYVFNIFPLSENIND